jgi:hypothetical protein
MSRKVNENALDVASCDDSSMPVDGNRVSPAHL